MQRHLRAITTERPGCGASSQLPGRRCHEPAGDLVALGPAAVHVVGASGSAPHQLAFAARHPGRVRALTVLVGSAPVADGEIAQYVRHLVTCAHNRDANAPLSAAVGVVERLPNATLVRFGEEGGRLAAYHREGEILDELLARR